MNKITKLDGNWTCRKEKHKNRKRNSKFSILGIQRLLLRRLKKSTNRRLQAMVSWALKQSYSTQGWWIVPCELEIAMNDVNMMMQVFRERMKWTEYGNAVVECILRWLAMETPTLASFECRFSIVGIDKTLKWQRRRW